MLQLEKKDLLQEFTIKDNRLEKLLSYIICVQKTVKKGKDIKCEYIAEPVDYTIFKKISNNDFHKKFLMVIPMSELWDNFKVNSKAKPTKEEQTQMVNVLLMPEMKSYMLKRYLSIYEDEPDNLKKYSQYLALITYNQIYPEKFKVKKYFEELMEEQSGFWEDPYNCNISLNSIFVQRKFNYDIYSTKKFEKDAGAKLDSVNKEITEKKTNYLADLDRFKDVNVEKLFEPSKNYWLSKQTTWTNSSVAELYLSIPTEYLKYDFLCNMICSRTHCHLILNNAQLLKSAQEILTKYKVAFKYIIGYGWLTLRQEEITLRNRLKDTDRVIFDLETANLLPIYPFGLDDINHNPYASVLLDKNLMNLKENCVSMEMIKDNYEKYYGLVDLPTIKKRINIFVNGTDKSGVLDSIDWEHYAITGSAMTACAMKYNPLIDLFRTKTTGELTDEDYSTYLFHYYNGSDIDLVCTHSSMYKYLDSMNKFITDVKKETTTPLIYSTVHIGSIVISEEFLIEEIEKMKLVLDSSTLTVTVEWIKKNLSDLQVKKYFYDKYYVPWKLEQKASYESEQEINSYPHEQYFTNIPADELRIYFMDWEADESTHKKTDYEKYIYNSKNKLICKLTESLRFQIKSSGFNRSWEIFMSSNENIFSTVGRFHMGFVRACWNGKTLLCTPSFISSMMLQLSSDYKYFASIRDPVEIINKYRSRGFGIILNDSERMHMAYYNGILEPDNSNSKWCSMYNVNVKDKASIKSIFGPKKLSHNIFKPSKYFEGMPDDCFKNIEREVYASAFDAFSSLYTKETEELYQYKCITPDGFVSPLNRNFIKLAYEKINKTNNKK
jgi:hypothetical protein